MDVRAADTSSLAAKRLELENVQPVKEKRGFMQDQMGVRKPEESEDQAKRPKSPIGGNEERGDEYISHESTDDQEKEAEEKSTVELAPPDSGEHILDVRV